MQPNVNAVQEGETVARVVYASVAKVEGSVYAEMERIRACAVRHNLPVGVHTALLHQAGWFVQWKEGPGPALLQLMDRVAGDPRHQSMRIVHSSRGPRLLDGPWSMAIVQCDDPPLEMAQRVLHLRRAMTQGLQYSPPAAWRKLSTPMRHPGAQQQAKPDAFQRVLVCAAAGQHSFALARWLAHQHKQELVHRRFAGAQDLDVGTDYVDFSHGERVMRVIAMARKGLLLPLTRAFLGDYSHVVLLLCDDAQRNLALIERVIHACAHLASPPAVLAVAADPARHATPLAMARRQGLIYLSANADPELPEDCWRALQPQLLQWRHAMDSGTPVVPLRRLAA